MSLRFVQTLFLLVLMALPLRVQASDVAALGVALRLDEVVSVIEAEGISYGKDLEADLFGGPVGARWQAMVGMIYDPATMRRRLDSALEAELAGRPDHINAMIAFFGSELGQRILSLEVSARRALLDETVEEASRIRVEDMMAEEAPRLAALRRFIDVNDLIESNVAGALNSNYAFYRGLADGGAFDDQMTDADIVSDVWGQEAEVRQETEDWLYPYLALAYQPLSDEDMAAYIAFSETDAGQVLNAALFAAFDQVFSAISRDLGLAAAQFIIGHDI